MSSEQLGSGVNTLKGDLAASFDILSGSAASYQDLGIARRFGGSAAAYSLRDIGAMNGPVVKVRRSSDGDERDFSAGAIASGGLESYATETVNMYTSNFATTDGFSAGQGAVASADGIGGKDDVLGFTLNTTNSSFHMAFKNIATSDETVRVQGEIYIPSSNNKVDSVAIFIDGSGGATQIGSTLVPTADQWVAFDVTGQVSGEKIHFRAKDGGTFTIEDSAGDDVFYLANVTVNATQSSGYVKTWYDQSGNGNNATQGTATNQPAIVENGGLVKVNGKPAIKFDGSDNYFILDTEVKFNSSASDKANTILNVAYIVSGNRAYMGLGSGSNNWFGVPYIGNYRYRDNGGNIINTGDAVPLNQQISFTFVSDESNDIETYQNGTSIHSDNSTFTTHLRIKNIGRSYNGANYNEMSSQEIVFFADDKTSEITDLHNEINNYYGI